MQHTLEMIQEAKNLSPDNGFYMGEYANQLVIAGRIRDALSSYKETLKLDPTNEEALNGSIKCQLLDGNLQVRNSFSSS